MGQCDLLSNYFKRRNTILKKAVLLSKAGDFGYLMNGEVRNLIMNLNMDFNKKSEFNLVIPQEIRKTMEERHIFPDEIKKVIIHATESGERFYNAEDLCYLADLRIKNITYWVRYAEKEDGIHILSVYSHRMEIVKE